MFRLGAPLLVLAAAAALADAPEPTTGAAVANRLAECRGLTIEAERLRCYDRLAAAPTTTPAAPLAVPAITGTEALDATPNPMPIPTPQASPVTPSLPVAAPSPPPPSPPPPITAVPAPTPIPTAPSPDSFGAAALPRAPTAEPARLQSRLAQSVDGIARGQPLRLDNGQVWQVIDDRSFEFVGDRPAVELDRNFIGTYWMKLDGGPRFKVRRVR